MPSIPSVFRSIRSNDFQRRPFKAYKSYYLTNTTYSGSGAAVHCGIYTGNRVDINDPAISYVTNSYDKSVQYLHWRSLNHKYYKYPYDPAQCMELTNYGTTYKYLGVSASILTLPYLDVGEQIKPGTVVLNSTPGTTTIQLYDDGYGNLCDPLIATESFASSSHNYFHVTFNDTYKKFKYELGQFSTGSIEYKLQNTKLTTDVYGVTTVKGPITTGIVSNTPAIMGEFTGADYISIPHHDVFNNFNRCDQWSISFWYKTNASLDESAVLFSKLGEKTTRKFITENGQSVVRDVSETLSTLPAIDSGDWNSYRMPFYIGLQQAGSYETLYFRAGDGSNAFTISSSLVATETWHHVLIKNSASLCSMFIDAVNSGTSGSLPKLTANNSNITIGNASPIIHNNLNVSIGEIRFYDYGVDSAGIRSLANVHYLSGSFLQTNVVGNVFYRNGQIVVSHPYNQRYSPNSGYFNSNWNVKYKGQHTIYENEILVRVPADSLNVSVNPSATWQLATGDDNACNTNNSLNGDAYTPASAEQDALPGNLRKTMFLSGSAYPYITTIGLYNDVGELLVVAKLSNPIQKRDDIDMNFIIRYDY